MARKSRHKLYSKLNPNAGSASPLPGRRVLSHLAALLLVVGLNAAVYASSLSSPFLYDDELNITANPYLRLTAVSARQIERALVQDAFQLRPLSNLSFAFDFYFHRLNRTLMRAENLLLHLAAASCLYALVYLFIPLVAAGPPSLARRVSAALFASLFWSLHPAHTQAVIYLVQRQTILASLGLLASLLFYLLFRRNTAPRPFFLAAALLSFLLAAGSKETGLLTPVYWLLLDFLFFSPGQTRREKVRACLLPGGVLVVTAGAALFALLATGLLSRYAAEYQQFDYGPLSRLATEARVVGFYLFLLFFPSPALLSLDPEVEVSRSLFSPGTTLPALLFLTALLVAGLSQLRRRPIFAFLTFGFFISLLPESSFLPIDLRADHRLYLYSLFVLPAAGAVLSLVLPIRRSLPFLVGAVVLLAGLAFCRGQVWHSALSVWRDAAAKAPNSVRPWSNYCSALAGERRWTQALMACERAVQLEPAEAMPKVNKAAVLAALGRKEEAAAFLQETALKHPESALAQYNYGVFLDLAGRTAEAEEFFRRALAADPFHREARLRLGRLLLRAGRQEGRQEIEILIKLFPDWGWGWMEWSRILWEEGARREAAEALRRAASLAGGDVRLEAELRQWEEKLRRSGVSGP